MFSQRTIIWLHDGEEEWKQRESSQVLRVIRPTAESEASCEKTHQLLPNLLSCFVRSSVKSHQYQEGQPPNTLLIGKLIPEAASTPPHPFPQGLKEPGFSSDGKAETSCVRVPKTTSSFDNSLGELTEFRK